eukprot:10166171-Lingulodinium_polyedra.AAC.1
MKAQVRRSGAGGRLDLCLDGATLHDDAARQDALRCRADDRNSALCPSLRPAASWGGRNPS